MIHASSVASRDPARFESGCSCSQSVVRTCGGAVPASKTSISNNGSKCARLPRAASCRWNRAGSTAPQPAGDRPRGRSSTPAPGSRPLPSESFSGGRRTGWRCLPRDRCRQQRSTPRDSGWSGRVRSPAGSDRRHRSFAISVVARRWSGATVGCRRRAHLWFASSDPAIGRPRSSRCGAIHSSVIGSQSFSNRRLPNPGSRAPALGSRCFSRPARRAF